MSPRPASPAMDSVCGRESSVSPPTVVAPVALKASPLNDGHQPATPTEQQRLLYQLALAERLRLASAGLAWVRPPLSAHLHVPHPHHPQEPSVVSSLMYGPFIGGMGAPLMGGFGGAAAAAAAAAAGYPPSHPLHAYGYRLVDPRSLLPRGPEEPKPQHSYIGLIAMAILSNPDKKLVLSDIYQYILDNYAYFRSRGPGWRNSIRHNLSLNDCFIKAGRSANGKGHYWAIHPANLDDFSRGDFRRRRAQRRVRKHLGLPVDDDSEPEASSPPHTSESPNGGGPPRLTSTLHFIRPKRQFDVLSLLAPDQPPILKEAPEVETDTVCLEIKSSLCDATRPIPATGCGEARPREARPDHDHRLEPKQEPGSGPPPHGSNLRLVCVPRHPGQDHKPPEVSSSSTNNTTTTGSQGDARPREAGEISRPVPFLQAYTLPPPAIKHVPCSTPSTTTPGAAHVPPTSYPRPSLLT
ncbi:forkhead box protein E3-like [Portunus trituberculatus]|uniref:Forkhead box protein B1 n=1 Tax=Portunus trituberculatus TaxID=210409 RepID=A0A5B7HEY3_PORTR|nr:forkhead box protein E3-like [Portunus trituberculatus]MPC68673.1 Forkhead box protein B1 [Portunus trituberculatus]